MQARIFRLQIALVSLASVDAETHSDGSQQMANRNSATIEFRSTPSSRSHSQNLRSEGFVDLEAVNLFRGVATNPPPAPKPQCCQQHHDRVSSLINSRCWG